MIICIGTDRIDMIQIDMFTNSNAYEKSFSYLCVSYVLAGIGRGLIYYTLLATYHFGGCVDMVQPLLTFYVAHRV
jgi:hypothetical protein